MLADEQVVGGKCWRCERPVVKKALNQWFFKITDYADALLNDLEGLDWPERIKAQQRNWIGRSTGAAIVFGVSGQQEKIEVFTTRPDTLFGATYMVLAPEHPLVSVITSDEHRGTVNSYVKAAEERSDIERMETDRTKTGVFTGAHTVNPATGKEIPIWVADYVLGGYGTGAIMAVPAHDQRDFEFAQKFELPIISVVEPVTGKAQDSPEFRRSIVAIVEDPVSGDVLSINWGSKQGGNLFIGGGREGDEDPEATAFREVLEETGYSDIELVSQTGPIHHHYFAASKNVAREIEAIGFHFMLKSHTQTEQSLELNEAGKFNVEWLTKSQAEYLVTDELHTRVYDELIMGTVYSGTGLMTKSGEFDGQTTTEAARRITAQFGQEKVNYKMRDWLISRQRYWGTPIPIIHCPKCGPVAVPEDQLPVVLPDMESYQPNGDGRSALARATVAARLSVRPIQWTVLLALAGTFYATPTPTTLCRHLIRPK